MVSRLKRLIVIHTHDLLEDHYDTISTHVGIRCMGLVRHRRRKTFAILRVTHLLDLDSVRCITHPNVAAVHEIFLNGDKSYVTYEHIELDLLDLCFNTEIEIASALSQVRLPINCSVRPLLRFEQLLDGVHHLTRNGIIFPADCIQVTMSGRLKIGAMCIFLLMLHSLSSLWAVLNIRFLPCDDVNVNYDYWRVVCAEMMESIRLPIMSYRALEFFSMSVRGELPDRYVSR